MATLNANNITELNTALSTAVPGDIIELSSTFLEPAAYAITNKSYAAPGITIRSQNTSSHAVFQHTVTVNNCSNITFENITFHAVNITANYAYLIHITGCSNVGTRYCNFVGKLVDTGNGATVAKGSLGWGKVVLENSTDCFIEYCYLRYLFKGITSINRGAIGVIRATLTGNMLERIDGDRLFFTANDLVIQDCYGVNGRSDQTVASPDHVDFFQGYIDDYNGAVSEGPTNVTLRRCVMDQASGAMTQLCFARSTSLENNATGNATFPAQAWKNFVVQDFLGIGQTTHGISLSSVQGATIERCAVFRPAASNPDPFLANGQTLTGVEVPDLRVTGQTGGTFVFDKIFAGANGNTAGLPAPTGSLFQDPSLGEVNANYDTLITGMSSTFDSTGDPVETNHKNLIKPLSTGPLATNGIGPTWWLNDTFAGPGYFNSGTQPQRPGDTSLWGPFALATWAASSGALPTISGNSMAIDVTVN